jgi:hypothetical protein
MSQRYPDINSPQFGQQARSTLVELMLTHLPAGIDGRKIDDRLVCRLGYLRRNSTSCRCLATSMLVRFTVVLHSSGCSAQDLSGTSKA